MKKRMVALLLAAVVMLSLTACDSADYKKATELYESGSYAEAEAIFAELGDYENSAEMVIKCRYDRAMALFDNKEYTQALPLLQELEAAGELNGRLNLVGWCALASYLENNHAYKQSMDAYVVTITMDGDAIKLDSLGELYHYVVWLRPDEHMAKVAGSAGLSAGAARMEESAETILDITTYSHGDEMTWDPHGNHQGTNIWGKTITYSCMLTSGGTFGKAILQVHNALQMLEIGVSLTELGFVNFNA